MTDLPPAWKRLVCALQTGATLGGACRYAGLPRREVDRCLRVGEREAERRESCIERGEDPGAETFAYSLWRQVQYAESRVEESALASVRAKWEEGDDTAARWYLERRFPRDWGRARDRDIDDRLSAEGPDTSDDALEQVLEILADADAEEDDQRD